MITFDDTSLMPFGKHCGKPLAKVPMHYLNWLWDSWDNEESLTDRLRADNNEGALARYVRSARNAEGLK